MPGLGASFGRGAANTFLQDLQHSDCILIQGSNFAECHPVGFRWVMAAKERGATIIHVDPHFSRTSQMADIYAPIRVGSDIAFLGGLAGGSYLASTLAHLFGSEEDADLIRAGRYVSLVGIIISPILLIKDLGRPERFHHMLRVLKLRSTMSLGTWGAYYFWTALWPDRRLPDGDGRAFRLVPGALENDESAAGEDNRVRRQHIRPVRRLLHRRLALLDSRSHMGARQAYPGSALPDFRPLNRACQPVTDPIAKAAQSADIGESGTRRTGRDDHRTWPDLRASSCFGAAREAALQRENSGALWRGNDRRRCAASPSGAAGVETHEKAHATRVEYRRVAAGSRGGSDSALCLGRRGARLRR